MDSAYIKTSHTYKLKSKNMAGVKEYGPLLGRLLVLFNVAFKAYDSKGKLIFINRDSFCSWLIDMENQERINNLTKRAFFHTLDKKIPSQKKISLPQALQIFKKEMKTLSLSMGGYSPSLLHIYEVMKEEFEKVQS